jgi:flagellar L-ring protein FlgH
MPPKRSDLAALACVLLTVPGVAAAKEKRPAESFAATQPEPAPQRPANGAIFQGSFTPLTSGGRAGQVGDILTVQLAERTIASKSSASGTNRDGSFGLTPPTTGPLALFNPSDVTMGGGQKFKGQGEASQTNSLFGELTVTVAAIYPNGTMLVRGEKRLTLNRGDEWVQVSGLVRAIDISSDNRILSTRIADASIRFTGKGDVARASRQGWLQRFFSIISPF